MLMLPLLTETVPIRASRELAQRCKRKHRTYTNVSVATITPAPHCDHAIEGGTIPTCTPAHSPRDHCDGARERAHETAGKSILCKCKLGAAPAAEISSRS